MEEKKETITIKKDALWKYSTFVLVGVLVLFLIIAFLPGKGTTGNVVDQPGNTLPTPAKKVSVDLRDDDHIRGDPNAPVTIFEYSDFECPFCQRHFTQTQGQIESNYVETGKVKFVYRHFPLSFHVNAMPAAIASECAAEQGMFWEMHDLLFEKGVEGGNTAFKAYASELGINTADFESCLSSGKYEKNIQSEMDEGATLGVRGTPGFFINGKPVSGAQPYSVFEQVIEAEL